MGQVSPIKKRPKRRKLRQYDKRFGISYNESTRCIRVSIPDHIKLPCTKVWVWLRDVHTLMISEHKPDMSTGAQHCNLFLQSTTPGCRYFSFGPVTAGLGSFFRMADTGFEFDGQRYAVRIPDEDERMVPKDRFRKTTKPAVDVPNPTPEEDEPHKNLVLIERGKSEFTFEVPDEELESVIGRWILKGYRTEG